MPTPRKPEALKQAQGRPGHVAPRIDQPTPPPAIPSPPNHLSRDAKREWRRVTKLMAAVGLLAEIDRSTLAAYCQAYGRWCKAERMVKKDGEIVDVSRDKSGVMQKSPWLTVAEKALDQMYKYMKEFGLTPAARTRLHVATTPLTREEKPATKRSVTRRAELLADIDDPTGERAQA